MRVTGPAAGACKDYEAARPIAVCQGAGRAALRDYQGRLSCGHELGFAEQSERM